jgi:hypothetical protein
MQLVMEHMFIIPSNQLEKNKHPKRKIAKDVSRHFIEEKINRYIPFVVPFGLRAYTLSHSFCKGFFQDRVSRTICPALALNHEPPDLCLLNS